MLLISSVHAKTRGQLSICELQQPPMIGSESLLCNIVHLLPSCSWHEVQNYVHMNMQSLSDRGQIQHPCWTVSVFPHWTCCWLQGQYAAECSHNDAQEASSFDQAVNMVEESAATQSGSQAMMQALSGSASAACVTSADIIHQAASKPAAKVSSSLMARREEPVGAPGSCAAATRLQMLQRGFAILVRPADFLVTVCFLSHCVISCTKV